MKNLLYLLLSLLSVPTHGQNIFTVVGGGAGCYDCPATNARLSEPRGIAIDDTGNLYIRDDGQCRVLRVRPAIHGIFSRFAGDGTNGYSGNGSPAVGATIRTGSYVGTGHKGEVYVPDIHRLRKVTPDGIIHTIAGTGMAGYNGDGIPATAAMINVVRGVVTDDTGNVYFVDGVNQRIRRIDTFGIITTFAGTGVTGYSPDGSRADTVKFNNISMLAIDKTNNQYYYDNKRIRKIDAVTHLITTITGTGVAGFSGDNGPATAAQIEGGGIAIDTSGNLFFADVTNFRIRKVDTDGIITTIAGIGTSIFSGDGGPATAAGLKFAQMVAVNEEGDIFLADDLCQRVRVITHKPLQVTEQGYPAATLKIAPNPTSGNYSITVYSLFREEVEIVVTDITGKEVLRNKLYTNSPIQLLNQLMPGHYVVTAQTKDRQMKETLIVR